LSAHRPRCLLRSPSTSAGRFHLDLSPVADIRVATRAADASARNPRGPIASMCSRTAIDDRDGGRWVSQIDGRDWETSIPDGAELIHRRQISLGFVQPESQTYESGMIRGLSRFLCAFDSPPVLFLIATVTMLHLPGPNTARRTVAIVFPSALYGSRFGMCLDLHCIAATSSSHLTAFFAGYSALKQASHLHSSSMNGQQSRLATNFRSIRCHNIRRGALITRGLRICFCHCRRVFWGRHDQLLRRC
jgi:hypothetical protein